MTNNCKLSARFLTAACILVCSASRAHGQGTTGSWRSLAPLPTARQELATAVLNGKIYVIGGYDENRRSTTTVDDYNPATDRWASAQPIPFANNHNGAAVAAGKLYAFGGISRSTFVYDPINDSWSPVATMLFGHSNTAAVGVINDKIYVAGGETAGNAMEVYDPAANTWTAVAPMRVPRNHCAGGVMDGKFYVVGGRPTAEASTALEVYDPQTNSWSRLASMPTGRSGLAAASVNGELWTVGGEDIFNGAVEVYNPTTNAWRQLPTMPTPRHGIWASIVGNRIYLPGGATEQGYGASGANDVFTVDTKATFANISTRLRVEKEDNVLIGGFIVAGGSSKRILLRAPGASVPLPGTLADPVLELYNNSGKLIGSNDNWQDAPNKQEIIDTTLAPLDNGEPAILTRVAPGSYTAVVRGVNSTSGVALVEVYDLEAGSASKLANISTRGLVQTDENVLIGGLILSGTDAQKVLVRAIGPSLTIPGALADPTLELRDGNGGLLATNDDWRTSQEADITNTSIPPSHNSESAIVQVLPVGRYTAIVRGVNRTTGLALVEAYALD
ncbi:MAG: Kelch repeat-containing protein [Chthoniobacterales bacterium]